MDASELAYAAVAYFRFNINQDIKVALVMGKARVMPIKPMSIPQAELTAATMGVRLANTIKDLHRIKISKSTYWSDSRVVLAWINSSAVRFKQFAGLRVREILDSTTRRDWRHVPTKLNVADDATKWNDPTISSKDRWFHRPEFFRMPISEWPMQPKMTTIPEDSLHPIMHIKNSDIRFHLLAKINTNCMSRWNKLRIVVAIRLRFLSMK